MKRHVGSCRTLDRRRQKPPVNADVRTGYKAAGRVRCEEHGSADQLLGAAKAVHGCVGEDLLATFGWGAVVFKEQAAVLLGGKKPGVMELTRTPLSAHSYALALGPDGLVRSAALVIATMHQETYFRFA